MLAPRADTELKERLASLDSGIQVDEALRRLIDLGADALPLPGGGETLSRWQALAAIAAHDLSLVKLFEGHADALAILCELGATYLGTHAPDSVWGTWCAEPPDARLEMHSRNAHGEEQVMLHGTKAWCSGAFAATHAVVSCWDEAGQPRLAAVLLDQPGVAVTDVGWEAIGMAATRSVDVRFDGARATAVGGPGDYVARPGFWQGGAGIAACWYGGAKGIAEMTRAKSGPKPDPHRLAHLGAMDVALSTAAAVLRETATWVDANPFCSAQLPATRARMVCERAATEIVFHAGRALGAAPLCRDARFARAMADLPVFIRQSHAERDLASLGGLLLDAAESPWTL